MKRFFTALSLLVLTFACQNNTEPIGPFDRSEIDYLVFGRFTSGEGGGDSQMFKVTRSDFTQEIVEPHFPRLNYEFNAEITMDEAAWNNAQQLLDLIPVDLINDEEDVYGCPDCSDQGGFFVEFGNADVHKKVLLDPYDTTDQSERVIAFKDAISTLILLWKD